jgi:hypothetical protein
MAIFFAIFHYIRLPQTDTKIFKKFAKSIDKLKILWYNMYIKELKMNTQLVELIHLQTNTKFLLRLTTKNKSVDLQEMWRFQWIWRAMWYNFRFNFIDYHSFNNYFYKRNKNYDTFSIEIFQKIC